MLHYIIYAQYCEYKAICILCQYTIQRIIHMHLLAYTYIVCIQILSTSTHAYVSLHYNYAILVH